jgi:hypothetical protein
MIMDNIIFTSAAFLKHYATIDINHNESRRAPMITLTQEEKTQTTFAIHFAENL